MRNITVAIDDATHRLARIRAAELDTSVSALVREYLVRLAGAEKIRHEATEQAEESEAERRARGIREIIAEIHAEHPDFSASDNLPRDELYEQARVRAQTTNLDDDGAEPH